jgi:hypothetical protein
LKGLLKNKNKITVYFFFIYLLDFKVKSSKCTPTF